MDPLIISACLFLPTFVIRPVLSAGRDQILFQTRPQARRSVVGLVMVASVAALLALGFPPSWAVGADPPGGVRVIPRRLDRPSASWIILRYRFERLLGRD